MSIIVYFINKQSVQIAWLIGVFSVGICLGITAQDKYTVSGYIYDAENGETVIGANVINLDNVSNGVVTNTYGYYALTLEEGIHRLQVSYIGYQNDEVLIDLKEDTKMDFYLKLGLTIETIEITSEDEDKNVSSTEMGTVKLQVDNIKKLPSLFGEVDILKTIQLLPGVLSSGEGSSGFNVRGGGVDQNLVLLDEAVVYNSGHLFGFFSVFNADAIKNATLIKGGMPANYGGRIASVLDVQMKDGNDKFYQVDGGIGLIASRLTVQGPVQNEKSSFLVSGRRTYLFDLAQSSISETDFAGTNYYFYDLNTKVNYKISNRDRLYFSGYFGRDVLRFNISDRDFLLELPYGNTTATMRWNHVFSDKLFANTSIIYNDYNFEFSGSQDDFKFKLFSGIRDWNVKFDVDYFHNEKHTFKAGLNYTYHKLTPNVFEGSSDEITFESSLEPKYGHETALYVSDDISIGKHLKVTAGLRYSSFTQVGPYTSSIDAARYEKGDKVKRYGGAEPRISARYSVNSSTSIKASYNRNLQYLHLVSNSTSSLPADVWVPSTELIKPQSGDQYSVGFFKNFFDNRLETSVELYYRSMDHQLDYRESYVDNASQDVELDFVFGQGEAYGAEWYVSKPSGRLTGWVAYTYAKTRRWFDEIENARKYAPVYDRTHDLSVVGNFQVSPKIDIGATFVFGSGRPFTPLAGIYFIDQQPRRFYGPRNSERLEDYHRLDFAINYTPKPKSTKRFKSTWTVAVYNMYNRKNTLFLDTDFDINNEEKYIDASASKLAIFPIIPSITWNFKWKSKKDQEVIKFQ